MWKKMQILFFFAFSSLFFKKRQNFSFKNVIRTKNKTCDLYTNNLLLKFGGDYLIFIAKNMFFFTDDDAKSVK